MASPDGHRWSIAVDALARTEAYGADGETLAIVKSIALMDTPIGVTVFGRKRTAQVIQDLKIDLVLTGHVHHASITTQGDENHQSVYLSASTALSSRTRGQENGFNVITLDDDHMQIEIVKLEGSNFNVQRTFEQRKTS